MPLPPTSPAASESQTWRQRGRAWWRRLVGPDASASAYWRDQTLLLSGLLLTLMALSLLAAGLTFIVNMQAGGSPLYVVVALSTGLLLGAVYLLNRRGRPQLAARLTVGITTLAIWASLIALPGTPASDTIVLAFLTVPLLLAGLLLPFWPMLAIAAGSPLVLALTRPPAGVASAFTPGAVIYLFIISGLTLAMTALSERQRRETEARNRELADSVAQFQSAFEYAAIGIALVAPDGRWLRVNRGLCALIGYTEAELQSLDFQTITHPDDLSSDLAQVRRMLGGELDTYQMEKRYFHKQGHIVWVSLSVSLVRGADGQPRNFISQIQDISERKQVEDALRASEARFRTLSDESPVGIYETDAQGRDVYQNARWLALTGLSLEEALGDGWMKAVHPEDRERLAAEWDRTVREHQPFATEFRFVARAGGVHWVQSRASAIHGDQGEIVGYVGTVADISERKDSEQKLQDANDRMQEWVNELEQRTRDIGLLNELSNLLQSCLTAQEAYGMLQQIGLQLFPRQAGLLGVINASRNMVETVLAWGGAPAPESFSPEDCWALRRGRAHWYVAGLGAVRCAHLGQAEPHTYLCLPMMAHGEGLGVLHLQAVSAEAPALSASGRNFAQTVADSVSLALTNLKLRERLRDQSIRDVLTGLFNRRYLEETLDRELKRAEREQAPVGVLILDIDNFKRFNDSFGHAAGDDVLRSLGQLVGRQVRVEDIACRYGGEEFTLVLPGCALEVARQRAETLREQVRDLRLTHAGQPLGGITISVGVAAFPQHGATEAAVLRAADAALYQAKQAGRNQVALAALPAA